MHLKEEVLQIKEVLLIEMQTLTQAIEGKL
jgi:hypothetical protein